MSSRDRDTEGWNHNTHYHDLLLGLVPSRCERALDVGCGIGSFARRLSPIADSVDAIDADATVIRRARELSVGFTNVRFTQADFMTWPGDGRYDFISMIAALHHMPFADAFAKASPMLRRGGVLAVLGIDRAPLLSLAGALSLIAWPVSKYYRATRRTSGVTAPIVEPSMTLAEIEALARPILPGASIRRHLLWRYSLSWTKP